MAKSGITASPQLESALLQFSESKADWIQIAINNETFEIVGQPSTSASPEAAFDAIKAVILPKEPIYVIYRVPVGDFAGKFVVLYHCPDAAKVKDRMLYASSIAGLKKGFGEAKFATPDTYRTSTLDEVSYSEFVKARADVDQRELLTDEELYKKEALKDSAGSSSVEKIGAIVQAHTSLKVKAGVEEDVKAWVSGSVPTLVFRLDPETEELEVVSKGAHKFENFADSLDKKEPRYALFFYAHEKDGVPTKASVFYYYCPDTAKPKLKMFYSSAKQMTIDFLAGLGVETPKKLQASDPAEINTQNVLTELYPKAVAKQSFAKPKAAGASKARRPVGMKFDAGPASPDASPDASDVASP